MNFVDELGNLSINKSSINWIKNGIIALGIAGAYSIIIVCLRTPFLSTIINNNQIFKSALIIHVDLSVLVWLISIVASIWDYKASCIFNKIYLRLSLLSTIIIGISPIFGQKSITNNYIPMLDNAVFILGLSLFGVSVLLFAINSLINFLLLKAPKDNQFITIGSITSAIMFIGVWICFIFSYRGLASSSFPIDIELYYELIYWSGGHLLQFLYTQALMIVWVILTSLISKKELNAKKIYSTILVLNFALSLLILGGHFNEISSAEFKQYFTSHMRHMGGIAPTLCLIALIYDTKMQYKSTHPFIMSGIICSCLLFLSGGLIGLLISGTNVTIPAHYHGSIVGISVAFMGFTYACIFLRKESKKWGINYASIQLYTITIGQVMHISGLAIAGGYGVLRKTTDVEMSLNIKLALGLMGGGGLIAIVGGLMFVIICGKNLSLFGNEKNLSNIS